MAVAFGSGHEALATLPEPSVTSATLGEAGVRPARRLLDLLGWKGGYFTSEEDARRVLRRAALYAGQADGGAEFAAVVQHRPALAMASTDPARATITSIPFTATDQIEISYEHPQPHALLHPGRQ